ncbi:hypothetical protein [Marinivivus vitaminiproducens]|uniref:hypothetical protein n=1 Tax=Marinivivus vitaminiproducens TaxID=3035935 RepID=UPI0027A605B4|nr:hypothetical protein P4R82_02175 [Geminicoccaceae bacterium SCSIO 64248]
MRAGDGRRSALRAPVFAAAGMLPFLAGCAATQDVDVAPSFPVLPAAGLPAGQFMVAIDESAMVAEANQEGFACPGGRYRLDLRTSFGEAVDQTVRQAVRTVSAGHEDERDVLGRPAGHVSVMADNLVVAVTSSDGFWLPVTRAQAALRATVRLRTADGRTTERALAGFAEAERSGTRACDHTDDLLALAVQGAMGELMREVAIVVRGAALAAEPPSIMVMAETDTMT